MLELTRTKKVRLNKARPETIMPKMTRLEKSMPEVAKPGKKSLCQRK